MNSIVQNLNYLGFTPTGTWVPLTALTELSQLITRTFATLVEFLDDEFVLISMSVEEDQRNFYL